MRWYSTAFLRSNDTERVLQSAADLLITMLAGGKHTYTNREVTIIKAPCTHRQRRPAASGYFTAPFLGGFIVGKVFQIVQQSFFAFGFRVFCAIQLLGQPANLFHVADGTASLPIA